MTTPQTTTTAAAEANSAPGGQKYLPTRSSSISTSPPLTDDSPYEWEYARPYEDLTRWERFSRFMYNTENGKILGRTPKGWGQIFLFYGLIYTVLAALFAICMKGLMSTIDLQYPRYTLDQSLIGTNPGMGFRPMPPNIEEGSVIWFVPSNSTNLEYWINSIDQYLEVYREVESSSGLNRQMCDYDKPPGAGRVCSVEFNSKQWGPCTKANNYGYSAASPCVFLKLNRIYGWEPEYYNDTKNLPEDMPESLQNYIKKNSKKMLNTIWVSCHGEGPTDNEYVGPIEYYPQPGFAGYFYPYTNTPGYLSPLVAVNFKRPVLNRLINIECRVWAKNVYYRKSSRDREGSVHFELLID